MTTYVLGPGSGDAATALGALGAGVIASDEPVGQAGWAARIAAQVAMALGRGGAAEVRPPFVLVAGGAAAGELADLGRAFRAARRSPIGYVVVDADLPPDRSETDWPDAPVTLVSGDEVRIRLARLRGWRVVEGQWPDAAEQVHALHE